MTLAGCDVAVVGAGAVGAAVAHELAGRGADVVLVDAGTRPAAQCSRANAGLLVPSHSEPLTTLGNIRTGMQQILRADGNVRLRPGLSMTSWLGRFVLASRPSRVDRATTLLRHFGLQGLDHHAALAGKGLDTGFSRQGMVDVFPTTGSLTSARAQLLRHSTGLEHRVLDAEELRELVPGITGHPGGIFFPDEAHCDGRRFVEALVDDARRLGCRTRFSERVLEVTRQAGRATGVRTTAGHLPARRVVLAAGTATSQIATSLGVSVPIAPGKGYVIDLAPGPEDADVPVGLKADMIVATPYPDRLRLAGTLELVGHGITIDRPRAAAIRGAAVRALPHLARRRVLSVWAGLRPCSADGLPIIGPVDEVEGLVLASGHGQQGVLLAPVTGRLVADHLGDEAGTSIVRDFLPARFSSRVPVLSTVGWRPTHR